jgi:RNA polymerase sigma-70 factor (ECF subfamily)
MARALRGDAASYEEALRVMTRVVRPYARARVGDAMADDVVQETLLTVHRARHTYDPRRPFGPWLQAITHSRVVDIVRRARRQARREAGFASQPAPVPEPKHTARHDLDRALHQLPPQQRRVIRMLKFDGMSASEVAQALGLSVSNVKVVAHRGYKAMRRRLQGGR